MRSIFVGIEYAGKTTLIDLLQAYYNKRGRQTHNDERHTSIIQMMLKNACSGCSFIIISTSSKTIPIR